MRNFYAASNKFGTNLTYDSIGWRAHMFDSKSERDEWVDDNCYADSGNIVAETCTAKTAHEIAGKSSNKHMYKNTEDNSFEYVY